MTISQAQHRVPKLWKPRWPVRAGPRPHMVALVMGTGVQTTHTMPQSVHSIANESSDPPYTDEKQTDEKEAAMEREA